MVLSPRRRVQRPPDGPLRVFAARLVELREPPRPVLAEAEAPL